MENGVVSELARQIQTMMMMDGRARAHLPADWLACKVAPTYLVPAQYWARLRFGLAGEPQRVARLNVI